MLYVFNGKHDAEAENSFASLKQNAPELIPHVTICVSDVHSREFAKRHNLRSFELSTINETGVYLTRAMNIMTRRKFECILHVLKQGEEVFYLDTDVVLLHNPLPGFNANYDINIQADECSRPYSYKYLCTGFMYIKPNRKTIDFLEEDIKLVEASNFTINDQNAFDMLVDEYNLLGKFGKKRIRINILDVCKFPNGCRYFRGTDKYCKKEDALIVHNNHITGIENKRSRFMQHGLLFVND